VFTGQEYQMKHSSKYRALQYYQVHRQSEDLTLPEMFASPIDTFVEEGVYVDFLHDFDFPPFFLAYFEDETGALYQVPYSEENNLDIFNQSVSGFSDVDRVRISFWRSSTYALGSLREPAWGSETITVKVIIFDENLMGAGS